MKSISIYIHIPFCIRKCKYCDFLSAPANEQVQEGYLCALKQEITRESHHYQDYTVKSVFIGGGTPTAVPAGGLCEILETVKHLFLMEKDAEITMEANPGTVTADSLALYRQAGVNRLSFGLQSANNKELALLGRIHTYEDFLESYRMAVDAGFSNINVDLMGALPGQSIADYEETLQKVLALNPQPEHISAYSLIIEEGTPFYKMYGEEEERLEHTGEKQKSLPSEEEEREMYRLTERVLKEAGYHHYEISNYGKPGRECIHNQVYWQRGNYVGFGIGAASMVENVRFQNTADLQAYMSGEACVAELVTLDQKEQMEEFMFLGLRLMEGIDPALFETCFGQSVWDVYGDVIRKNVEQGLLQDTDRIRLTEKGVDVSNYVMAQFLLEE